MLTRMLGLALFAILRLTTVCVAGADEMLTTAKPRMVWAIVSAVSRVRF